MRILFINLPYYGHFIPTVGLVQEIENYDLVIYEQFCGLESCGRKVL